MANLAHDLFDAAPEPETPTPKQDRRVKLYPWDSVAAQLLEPFGESALDTLSLQQLWKAASEGNKKAAYHSHLCADKATDMWHVGAGVSLTAAALQAAIKNLESENMQRLLREDLYQKIMAEVADLKPILEKLNIGKGSQKHDASGTSMREAKRQKTGTSTVHAFTEEEVVAAAAKFHAWLSQEKSALRGALFVLSGNNSYYAAHTAEFVARACIQYKPLSAAEMTACMRARLSKPAESQESKRPGQLPLSGLVNLGNSCFINASIQAVLAIPTVVRALSAQQQSSLEEELHKLLRRMQTGCEQTPRAITDLYYVGRQEDAAEFLVDFVD
ncbi:unnamed protein product, partial [Symbiodinium necroappetens]